MGIASLVLGIIAIVGVLCIPIIGIICGVVGLILGIVEKEKNGIRTGGIVTSAIGFVLSILMWIIYIFLLQSLGI